MANAGGTQQQTGNETKHARTNTPLLQQWQEKHHVRQALH